MKIEIEVDIPKGKYCGLCDFKKSTISLGINKCLLFNENVQCKEYPKFKKCDICINKLR